MSSRFVSVGGSKSMSKTQSLESAVDSSAVTKERWFAGGELAANRRRSISVPLPSPWLRPPMRGGKK